MKNKNYFEKKELVSDHQLYKVKKLARDNQLCKVVEKGAQMWYNNHARALFFERRQSYE